MYIQLKQLFINMYPDLKLETAGRHVIAFRPMKSKPNNQAVYSTGQRIELTQKIFEYFTYTFEIFINLLPDSKEESPV